MSITVEQIDLHVINTRTRMPFKYGIATLEAVPHVFVRIVANVNGAQAVGIASEGLAPKWFTKNPDTSAEHDIAEMMEVIRMAVRQALQIREASTVFAFWRELYDRQRQLAKDTPYPPLLWAFGVTMVERALICAWCRGTLTCFADALRTGTLGVDLGVFHEELTGTAPTDWLPAQPVRAVVARHTVGLADPLEDGNIPDDERVDDDLPQSLDACVAAYGLTHFKVKLFGDVDKDVARLTKIVNIIGRHGVTPRVTLDGNEFFRQVEPFRRLWTHISQNESLRPLFDGLLFVEQPFHRDAAFGPELKQDLLDWADRPAIVIDESDGTLDALRIALDCGYAGTSFKNCKGTFKGVANACMIARLRAQHPDRTYLISAEDLCSIGPVAMIQDLAVAAALGIDHVERNGHHYYRGLGMFPDDVQEQMLLVHGDLYHALDDGTAVLNLQHGLINVGSVVDAPFGIGFDLDTTRFQLLDNWRYESL